MTKDTTKPQTERWATRVGVILAVAGSAVGLGNFLRFPGQAVANGGGAFMIPYFCALVFLGIPIGWAEWTMGRYGGRKGFHSAPGILGVIGKGAAARYLGVFGLMIPMVVFMYYGLIESWCLRYTFSYITGAIDLGQNVSGYTDASTTFFNRVSGAGQNGIILEGHLDPSVIFWIIVFALNMWLIYRGISRGIEKFCRWAMPAMAVCAVIVLIRVLTLGTPDPAHPERSLANGLGYMWNPDLSKLDNFQTWLAAAGQIFFSLSVGFGVIINYASYLTRKDDVVLSGLTASATNELFEVGFGGLITIPAAFVFLGVAGTVGGTFGLGFNTLPVVFAHMGIAGHLIGASWFFMLFLAAITSSLSMLQPVMAFLNEATGLSRGKAALLLSGLSVIGSGWVVYFSKDLVALDTMDFWVGTFMIFLLATVQVICFAWVFGAKRGLAEAREGARLFLPRLFSFVIKYITPTYLLVVLAGFSVQNLPDSLRNLGTNPVAQATVIFMLVVLAFLVIFIRIGERRWRAAGLDLDGKLPPDD